MPNRARGSSFRHCALCTTTTSTPLSGASARIAALSPANMSPTPARRGYPCRHAEHNDISTQLDLVPSLNHTSRCAAGAVPYLTGTFSSTGTNFRAAEVAAGETLRSNDRKQQRCSLETSRDDMANGPLLWLGDARVTSAPQLQPHRPTNHAREIRG